MFGKKKSLNGFNPKPKQRTKKEVDNDYQMQAVLLGHKSRILANLQTQLKNEIERVENEIKEHLDKLLALNEEGMRLPQEEAPQQLKVAGESSISPPQDVL